VFILVDDLGYSDLGAYGSRLHRTPQLDRLAREGLRMTDGYASGPNCRPTRAALLSGQYAPRTGVYTAGSSERFARPGRRLRPVRNAERLPLEKATIAQALAGAGYATGMFGKWDLGDDGGHHPGRRGFGEAIVSRGGYLGFTTLPPVDHAADLHLTDFLTERALDFIRRRRDERFFLFLSHFAVHRPYLARPDLLARASAAPAAADYGDPSYAALLAQLDESTGRILALLDELGLAEETLVIFSSDNGGIAGYGAAGAAAGHRIAHNAPLRAGKGSLYEGGIRVPWVFRWPGRIPAATTCDAPITSVDLFPTLLELAGAAAPAGQPLDGESLARLLASGCRERLARDALYWHFPDYLGTPRGGWRTTPAGAIRAGRWKLLEFFEDGRFELYDLREDVGESRNLAAAQPERARELQGRLAAWRQSVAAPLPDANDAAGSAAAGGP
jgi:arylsulfatase A-like enzyme